MSDAPFMPKATAVWLVENTTLSFKQIANFCNLHELEIKGIADGDVAKGIKAYNPILAGQLSREEIENCSKDSSRKLRLIKKLEEVQVYTKGGKHGKGGKHRRQFLLYCKCELKRRDETLSLLREENLFDPNVKTVFVVNDLDSIADIQQDIQHQGILIREQSD